MNEGNPCAAEQQKAVPASMNRLACSIDECGKLILKLDERLSTVCRQPEPEAKEEEPPTPPIAVALEGDILANVDQVDTFVRRIRSILSRLEI